MDNIIDNIYQPICLISKTSTKTISYINHAMATLINVSSSVIDKADTTFSDYFTFVDSQVDGEQLQNLISADNPVLLKVLNGQTMYYNGYFSSLDDTNLILLLTPCLLKKNVIENKFLRNHEQVVDFLENAPIGLHSMNAKSEIVWMNKLERTLLGFECEEEVRGKNVDDVS